MHARAPIPPASDLSPDTPTPQPTPEPAGRGLALVMTGGGARAAYQVGVLRGIARCCPAFAPSILTGVSAGGINAAYLAGHAEPFPAALDGLSALWSGLRTEHVFDTSGPGAVRTVFRWGRRLLSGGARGSRRERGLLDPEPLRQLLRRELGVGPLGGVAENLRNGRLDAFAITTTSYTTGQSITWVQGRDVEAWDRPYRRAVRAEITADHVLASSALPFFFPAVYLTHPVVGDGWYGDGGIRLTAPLSPALHLGARKIIAINTRYGQTAAEAAERVVDAYPPPAQVLGVLMNAIFLDLLDRDAQVLRRINALLASWPDGQPGPAPHAGFRPVGLLVLRPSRDLAKLAGGYEPTLPPAFRFLMRGLGVGETRSPDWLSMLLFEPDYLRLLVEIGEADAEAQADEIAAFLDAEVPA
ncbi:MAG TPA: patatin-like phospholipase family protein [Rubricoccaceae bacterium]|nr:patatin-like phospholipase family protein [Rubricoccaceae bacterium]